MADRPYQELTRRERLYRFRQLAEMVLHEYGLDNAGLQLLQYGENVIYRVNLKKPIGQREDNDPFLSDRCILRLHAWDNLEYINSEMIWLAALSEEAELPVPAPLRTKEGSYFTKVSSPKLPKGKCATLLRWLDGRKLEKSIRPKHLHAIGSVIAKLHNFSSQWTPPAAFKRPDWDWDAQLGGSHFNVEREVLIASMPKKYQVPFRETSDKAKKAMASLGTGSDAFGLIHSDLYPENILFKSGEARPIDFEDCGYGYWMWDIAVALSTWAWKPSWEVMRDAFLEGYIEHRTLPQKQWELLDLFIATQFATMLIWACAFIMHDPVRTEEYIPWREDNGERLLTYFK